MTDKRKGCPMRHENGNCTVAGGFCTAVNNPICEALHNAFDCGHLSALRQQEAATDRHQMTNADRIRAMSDLEIADWVSETGAIKTPCDIICGGDCKAIATIEKSSIERCKEIVMKWLQQPAEEDGNA